MKRKVTAILLVMLIVMTTFIPTINASYQDQKDDLEEKVEEAKDKKEEIKNEKKNTLSEIADLEDSIMAYESELRKLEDQIRKLEKNIKTKTEEIEELQKDFEKKQQLLEDRLVAIYEEGQITFLDVILSSENIIEYISMSARIQELTESDNKQMDEVENQRKEVEKAKRELEAEKKELDTAKKTADTKQKQLKVTKNSKESKVSTLSSQEKAIQKEIDKYNAEIKEIDKKIQAEINKANGIYSGSFSGTLGWPLSSSSRNYNIVTSRFGPRNSPVAGASSNHRGIDMGVSIGTPVYSSADGYVVSVMHTGARGLFVLIKHGDNLYTRYQHLNSSAVSSGQYVKRGQKIATSGNTGIGSGPHLHFEILTQPYYGYEINPLTCGLLSLPSNLIYY